ncbi:hypothetical protein LE190_10190 [Massilia oculi]|uniref:Uncharacterized protein n=1 Tax=Massilia hydrophila TaxID=3044279 RepID=A0ABS7YCP1_9BURK|nr:hypothetical protein [Massilia oculi]MCA1856294.1 hypothetical protein [Massilia oculi]
MFKSAIGVLLAMFCSTVSAQEAVPFSELLFQGPSAYRPGINQEYFLFGRGFPPGVGPDEEAALIAEWKSQHPRAKLVPVSILGERSRLPIVYVWAVDGEATLNLVLVRNGVYPGIAMLDGTHFSQVLQSSRGLPSVDVLDAQQRLGNPTRIPARRLVPDTSYEKFLKQLMTAESQARAELKGIWSDRFKQQRHRLGIVPLDAVRL